MKTHAHPSHWTAAILLTMVAFVLAVSPGGKASAAIVHIPDPGLEAAIRDALGKPTGPITDTDLEGLVFFGANCYDVEDLTGLEYCVNMEHLSLRYNSISDLGPLSALTSLVSLDLEGNDISDIQPLLDNPGLGLADEVFLHKNPLSCKAITVEIPILEDRDVFVMFDPLAFLHVSIQPRILRIESRGKWVTCSIRTGQGCDVGDIDVAGIRLEDTLEVQRSRLYPWWGTLAVKFNRSEVLAMVGLGEVELTLTGQFRSGLEFTASDTIRVIDTSGWWWW